MALKQTKAWIRALALASVLAAGSSAQDVPWEDLQLFAPAVLDPLSGHPQPKEGLFATFSLLHWSLQPPDKSTIGREGIDPLIHDVGLVRREVNSFNTSYISAEFHDGQRFELGGVKGHWGWLFRSFGLKGRNQTISGSDVDVNFRDVTTPFTFAQLDPNTGLVVGLFTVQVGFLDGFVDQSPVDTVDDDQDGDGIFGRFWDGNFDGVIDPTNAADVLDPRNYDLDDLVRLPTTFTELSAEYSSEMWGLELMPFRRMHQFHHGGNLEVGIGLRYLRFDDDFDVQARGLATDKGDVGTGFNAEVNPTTGGPLTESFWFTESENNIVGPQAVAHYFRTKGRWTLSAQGRFFAGWNFQNIYQRGSLNQSPFGQNQTFQGPRHTAHNLFLTFPEDEFNHNLHSTEWSPGVEVELGASFQLTRAIAAVAAWNGLWIEGIARSPNLVDYTLPRMGLLASENRQDMFIHGFNVGIEVNR